MLDTCLKNDYLDRLDYVLNKGGMRETGQIPPRNLLDQIIPIAFTVKVEWDAGSVSSPLLSDNMQTKYLNMRRCLSCVSNLDQCFGAEYRPTDQRTSLSERRVTVTKTLNSPALRILVHHTAPFGTRQDLCGSVLRLLTSACQQAVYQPKLCLPASLLANRLPNPPTLLSVDHKALFDSPEMAPLSLSQARDKYRNMKSGGGVLCIAALQLVVGLVLLGIYEGYKVRSEVASTLDPLLQGLIRVGTYLTNLAQCRPDTSTNTTTPAQHQR